MGEQYETKAEDKVPFGHQLAYGLGAFVNNLLAGAMGSMMIVLNLGLGMDPALVGLLGSLPRITDAITDPLMGFISDNTRTKWGRRRPYILVGAIAVGIVYALIWQLPRDASQTFYFWYFLGGSLLFYLAYTVFATPWVALGYELTPDYHERTRLMAIQNALGQFAYMVTPWCLWFMSNENFFADQLAGAQGLGIAIGVVAIAIGILPALVLRERFTETPSDPELEKDPGGTTLKVIKNFFSGFATTLRSKSFLKLGLATFLVFNGFMLVSSFSTYVIIYYVFGGNEARGAEFAGYAGTLGALSTFVVILIVTTLSRMFGKRRAFFFAIAVSIIGYGAKWFCYNPAMPWLVLLPAPLQAFGLGGLFTLMPAMIADVVDEDELTTHERREGMYGSIFWWVVKVGMAAALAAAGPLLNVTGFDVALGGGQGESTLFMMRVFDVVIPMLSSVIAIWAIYSYPITEERAHEIRTELEERREAARDAVAMSA